MTKHNTLYLFIGETFSSLGDWLTLVALTTLSYQQNASPLDVAKVLSLRCLPHVFFGALGGKLADKYNKQVILIISELTRGCGILLLVFFQKPCILWGVTFLVSLLGTISHTSLMSLIPILTNREKLTHMNSILMMGKMIAMFVGPIIAVFCISTSGISIAFFIDALSYIVYSFMVFKLQVNNAASIKHTHHNIESAFISLKIKKTFVFNFIFYCFIGIWLTLMPVVSSHILQLPQTLLGLTMFINGVGALVGSLYGYYFLKKVNLLNCQIISILGAIIFLSSLFHFQQRVIIYSAILGLGLSESLFVISGRSWLQTMASTETLGKTMAIRKICENVGLIIGMFCYGLIF